MEPVHVLWLGDPSPAQQVLASRAPHIRLTERGAAASADSLLADAATADLLVIDATLEGIDTLDALERLKAANIDLPVVLLTWPDVDDLAARASLLAVCDVVVKVAGFALQLLPAMEQVRARHDLVALFRSVRDNQDRLRTILEFQPAVTCIVSTDGVVSAMNQAGLALLGVEREQLAGRVFTSLVPPNEQERVDALVRRVCHGETGELDHSVVRPDGQMLAVRTRAVPLRQGDVVVALATMVDRTATVADHAALRQLRTDLSSFMTDIDDRCRTLIENDGLVAVHGAV